ncbi:LOW QUALITY PROTEIN: hypothetical protein B0I72DRAFT_170542 [Yarrowia lipolytica]|uniref:Uncharacterized protein n=1 Tax=Yarrowia lipolytica TaxID=4952 RepID=A0A371C9S8_YARLL|nr:LOW QUALITY PROTEIN: hypothetical protein B0I71DRAFT_158065 [Yarrowia lipolytica]RDW30279.1 LOW QUALITY PROTEIN: hypothetical protein B0I72DRAFT_170542 [Yarrowia lipolytica]RDW46573.1 LOW QUALITY PROTEIN: hypothetical protein B0I74DRAFT_167553 [Yarrowia lipolytica]RDW51907.1 LOW QUALITY PROTEIN: hypothetical protein B0I75DRAFT_164887 [Yarrowia lipolytica]
MFCAGAVSKLPWFLILLFLFASFSNAYLVEYSYNQDSVFFETIKNSFKQSNSTNLKARSGFFGARATVHHAIELSITQQGTNSSALCLVQLAGQFTGDIDHSPRHSCARLSGIYLCPQEHFAFIPGANQAGIMMVWTAVCSLLTWSVCTIWLHVSTLVRTIFTESSSAGAVTSVVGGRLLIGLLAVWSSIRKAKKEADYEARE